MGGKGQRRDVKVKKWEVIQRAIGEGDKGKRSGRRITEREKEKG